MKEKMWDLFDGGEWREVPDAWLDGIPRKDLDWLEMRGDKLLVTYNKGTNKEETYSYDNVFGVWGNEIRFE